MRACGVTGRTHCGDYIALVYILTDLDIKIAVVSIKRLNAAAMVYDYVVTIACFAPFCFNNSACCRSVDVASVAAACNIHTGVAFVPLESAAYISAYGRPDKAAWAGTRIVRRNKNSLCAYGDFSCNRFCKNYRSKNLAVNNNAVLVSYKSGDLLFSGNALFGYLGIGGIILVAFCVVCGIGNFLRIYFTLCVGNGKH